MMPKLSVILPIYNVEKYLEKCLRTIVDQTLKDIEIICVIDNSPDRSLDICKSFKEKDSRIKIINKNINEGLGLTRNCGLKYASGRFVAFVDSDDYLDLNMYKQLFDYANENNLDACFCDYQYDKGDGNIVKSRELKYEYILDNRDSVLNYMLDMISPLPEYKSDVKYLVSVWHGIYLRTIIEENRILFESERINASEDLPFHIDFLSVSKRIGYIPISGYYYRYNPVSLSRNYSHDKFKAYNYLFDEVHEKLVNICPREKFVLHYQRFIFYFFRNIIKYEAVKNINGEKYRNIKMRCEDQRMKELYLHYPYNRLPLKQRVFFICMKHSIVWVLYMMCVLENKIRKNI